MILILTHQTQMHILYTCCLSIPRQTSFLFRIALAATKVRLVCVVETGIDTLTAPIETAHCNPSKA